LKESLHILSLVRDIKSDPSEKEAEIVFESAEVVSG
jgi:hypothetical protein